MCPCQTSVDMCVFIFEGSDVVVAQKPYVIKFEQSCISSRQTVFCFVRSTNKHLVICLSFKLFHLELASNKNVLINGEFTKLLVPKIF